MKAIIFLCVCAIAYSIFGEFQKQRNETELLKAQVDRLEDMVKKQAAIQESEKNHPDVQVSDSPRTATFDQLSLVRGEVEKVTPAGIIVLCALESNSWQNFQLPANAGAAESAALARLAVDQERRQFGDALWLKDGRLIPSNHPPGVATGRVLVVGHPMKDSIRPGKKVKLVTLFCPGTKNSPQFYTMNFIYEPTAQEREAAKPGAWMYERGRTMLDGESSRAARK